MTCWNLTKNTSGVVTAVAATQLTVTGVVWDNGDLYRVTTLEADEKATIEMFLDVAASDLHAAMAASNQCSCTLATWAAAYLEKLNIVDASIYHQCPCAKPNISDDMRKAWLEWMNLQLELIRTGKIELCAGATGAEYPSLDWAEQAIDNFSAANLLNKR
jgi:hypothetical protein